MRRYKPLRDPWNPPWIMYIWYRVVQRGGWAVYFPSFMPRFKPIGRTITKIPPHACTNLEFIFLIHLYLLRVYKMVRYKWYRTYSIFVMVYFKCVFIEIVYNIMCNIVVHRYISVFNRNDAVWKPIFYFSFRKYILHFLRPGILFLKISVSSSFRDIQIYIFRDI